MLKSWFTSFRALGALLPLCGWLAPNVVVPAGTTRRLTTGKYRSVISYGGSAIVHGIKLWVGRVELRAKHGPLRAKHGPAIVTTGRNCWLTITGGVVHDVRPSSGCLVPVVWAVAPSIVPA